MVPSLLTSIPRGVLKKAVELKPSLKAAEPAPAYVVTNPRIHDITSPSTMKIEQKTTMSVTVTRRGYLANTIVIRIRYK